MSLHGLKFIKRSVVFGCLGVDELCELGEGDFREVAFDEGSSMNPWATGGDGLPQSGATDREAVEK